MSGAPCPPFSSAGKGKGMADPRGWLLLSSVKYAIVKRPPVFGSENVKGLASRGNKWILKRIQRILKLAGYKCFCAMMDTREHGVPQSRPRIYLIALLVKHLHPDRPFSFPEPIPQPRLKRFLVNTANFEKKPSCPRVRLPMSDARYLPLKLYKYIYIYINMYVSIWFLSIYLFVYLLLFYFYISFVDYHLNINTYIFIYIYI